GHTSDFYVKINNEPDRQLLKKASDIINLGNKVVILIGQGALNAGEQVVKISEKIKAPTIKAFLGKAVVPDEHPNCLGGIGMLGTSPSVEAMDEVDTLIMIGTSFPYIDYLPKPGQARGIQIDIKPERIGLCYPVEVGLVGDSNITLSRLIPLLEEKQVESVQSNFLKSMQKEMKKWMIYCYHKAIQGIDQRP
ncbi:MAG: pyruvate oxidase, partial [Nitrososphaeraceae archaeon]